jgi:hypothetical protein
MFIWGLVCAKAKTGYKASMSKDKETVTSSFKKLLGMVALITVATLAKLNVDTQFVESWLNPSSSSSSQDTRLLLTY